MLSRNSGELIATSVSFDFFTIVCAAAATSEPFVKVNVTLVPLFEIDFY